jgi:hypothetical protein
MKLNKIKGSAILVVIFSSIAFFIYVMSVYSEAEHFNIMQNKYEKNINKKYEVDENEFYEKILEEYQILNNV